jgi:hypothetical protein
MIGDSLRGVEGLVKALLEKNGAGNAGRIDATTLCRRIRSLDLSLPKRRLQGACLVGDGTGLRLVDEGGYKTLVHGREKGKRREYQQVIIIADAKTGEIVEIDSGPFRKGQAKETDRIRKLARHNLAESSLVWDGAGDDAEAYADAAKLGLRFIAPPDKSAVANSATFPPKHPRTKAVRERASIGRAAWKKKTGYHRRSMVESVNHRFKALFGASLASRNDEAKRIDVILRAKLYNATLGLDQLRFQR